MFKPFLILAAVFVLSGCQLQTLLKPEVSPQAEAKAPAKVTPAKVVKKPAQKPEAQGLVKPVVPSLLEDDLLKAEQNNAIQAGRLAVIKARLHEVCPVNDFEKSELKLWSVSQDQLYLGNQDSPFKSYYEHGKDVAQTYTTEYLKSVLEVTSKEAGLSYADNCKKLISQAVSNNEHLRAFNKAQTDPPTFSF